MNFSVMVHAAHGQFEAALVGAPDVRVTAPTRAEALAALETALGERVEQGELVTLEVGRKGLAGLFGKYRDDPTLQDICDEAYPRRLEELRYRLRDMVSGPISVATAAIAGILSVTTHITPLWIAMPIGAILGWFVSDRFLERMGR